jgi:hypothetical protein
MALRAWLLGRGSHFFPPHHARFPPPLRQAAALVPLVRPPLLRMGNCFNSIILLTILLPFRYTLLLSPRRSDP